MKYKHLFLTHVYKIEGGGRLDSPRPPLPPQTASFDAYVSQAFLELT